MRHHPLNTPVGRFRIETLEEGADSCAATMPVAGLVSPVTGLPTISPLAVLVDHVGGLLNHHRRDDREWTVTSELTLELAPDALTMVAAHPDAPVRATARPLGAKHTTAATECHLCVGDVIVGSGTVRSFYIEAPATYAESPDGAGSTAAKFGLASMMATGAPQLDGGKVVLPQLCDEVLNNSLGVVHGGIAATGLEVVAAAAINHGRTRIPEEMRA